MEIAIRCRCTRRKLRRPHIWMVLVADGLLYVTPKDMARYHLRYEWYATTHRSDRGQTDGDRH